MYPFERNSRGKGTVNTNELTIDKVTGKNKHLGDYVQNANSKAEFGIKDTLTLKSFEQGVKFRFNGGDMHGVKLAPGASLNLGSAAEFELNDQGKVARKDYGQGNVDIREFRANWTQNSTDSAKSEWTATNHKLGSMTVGTNAKLYLRSNKFEDKDSREKYHASIEMDRLNFVSSNIKLNYKIDTKTVIDDIKKTIKDQQLKGPEGLDNWTGSDFVNFQRFFTLDAQG